MSSSYRKLKEQNELLRKENRRLRVAKSAYKGKARRLTKVVRALEQSLIDKE